MTILILLRQILECFLIHSLEQIELLLIEFIRGVFSEIEESLLLLHPFLCGTDSRVSFTTVAKDMEEVNKAI